LQLDKIEEVLRPAVDQAKQVVDAQRNAHPNLIHDDTYLERLAALIGSNIGAELEQSTFDKRCTEAQARIDRQQPPGYRDAKKPAPERYGDVLIWYELLDKAEVTKQPVVFVTDDDKEDWWQIVAGQKLGPRPELREEMRKRAGVEFYIYNPAVLLQTASQQLNLGVSESSVDDAAKVAAELRMEVRNTPVAHAVDFERSFHLERSRPFSTRYMQEFGRAAEESVYRMLVHQHPTDLVRLLDRGPFDFLVEGSSGRLAVEVKAFRQVTSPSLRLRVRDSCVRAFYELSKGVADDFRLYLVAPDEEAGLRLADVALGGPPPDPAYTVSVGMIGPDGAYIEIGQQPWGRYP
jgi:hypothetical protein